MEDLRGSGPTGAQVLHRSHSSTRLGSPQSHTFSGSRPNTLQNDITSGYKHPGLMAPSLDEHEKLDPHEDIFEADNLVDHELETLQAKDEVKPPQNSKVGFNELPMELVSLTDRFIESLVAKVYNTPPSIDKLCDFFQEFYVKAERHIATHISALSTRQSRGASPCSSTSSRTSSVVKDGTKLRSSPVIDVLGTSTGVESEQQMLTPLEILDRRKARRLLDLKRAALEEIVEQKVCERVYDRLWRHRSTLDEVRDEKLRSRTAALALVGIGLSDLGIRIGTSLSNAGSMDLEAWIAKARNDLLRMNDAKYPLGKLQQLAAAHRNIVNLLTSLHQSSSSADEILPTLIYTLITTPPEGINVISNLQFIQRFRAANKLDGEAAYCLVNLEAAITFLETVDLTSLRPDEPLEGPSKSASRPIAPLDDTRQAWLQAWPSSHPISSPSVTSLDAASELSGSDHPLESPSLSKPLTPASSNHQRRLSDRFLPPATAFGAAGDAVRTTADQGMKTISTTLDNSLKFLFGRLKERQVAGDSANGDKNIVVPKTLIEARKLIEIQAEEEGESGAVTMRFSQHIDDQIPSSAKVDKGLFNVFASRKQTSRERNVDNIHSSGSGTKRVAFAAATEKTSPAGNAAVESMLSLSNTLNPLKSFPGFGVRGFGRASPSSKSPTPGPALTSTAPREKSERMIIISDESSPPKVQPPIQRFIEMESAQDLKIGEIVELLQSYKRLAGDLKDLGAF